MKYALLALAILAQGASAQAANTVTLTWAAPTKHVDGSAITGTLTYNIYQGIGQGSTKTKINFVTGSPTTISTGLVNGNLYCFQVTAVEAGVEGGPSNEACKAFAASPPGTVSITIQ